MAALERLEYEPYPRDEEHRYRVYAMAECDACNATVGESLPSSPSGWRLHVGPKCSHCRGSRYVPVCLAAASDPGGVGQAIVTIAQERREAGIDPEIVGVLDALEGRWLTSLWQGGR